MNKKVVILITTLRLILMTYHRENKNNKFLINLKIYLEKLTVLINKNIITCYLSMIRIYKDPLFKKIIVKPLINVSLLEKNSNLKLEK